MGSLFNITFLPPYRYASSSSGIPIPDILALEFATLESSIDLVRIIKSLDGIWLAWNDKQGK